MIKYIEDCVINKKWPPDVAIQRAKRLGWNFKIHISAKTIYNYIDRNQIKITPFDLRFKLRKRKPKRQYIKQNMKKLGKSIGIRPEYINNRSEFEHWEGDTIVDKNNNSILVLQERTSRKGMLLKLNKHISDEVNRQLKILKNKYGKHFKNIFKTITFDNGEKKEYTKGIKFIDVVNDIKSDYKYDILCGKFRNQIVNYNDSFIKSGTLNLYDMNTKEGNKIYERGLILLFEKSVRELLGKDVKIKVSYSIDKGVFCQIDKFGPEKLYKPSLIK